MYNAQHINVTYTFGSNELSIIAFALGKTDLNPNNVTPEEVAQFMLGCIKERVEKLWADWLENGGDAYETQTP